jgi:hypothetical protein
MEKIEISESKYTGTTTVIPNGVKDNEISGTLNDICSNQRTVWRPCWHESLRENFMIDVIFLGPSTSTKRKFTICDAVRFVNNVTKPFGIVICSEKRGRNI